MAIDQQRTTPEASVLVGAFGEWVSVSEPQSCIASSVV